MARRELIRVRLARRELEALDRLAMARGGLTRSELVREADPAPRPAPTLAELLKPFAEPPLTEAAPSAEAWLHRNRADGGVPEADAGRLEFLFAGDWLPREVWGQRRVGRDQLVDPDVVELGDPQDDVDGEPIRSTGRCE